VIHRASPKFAHRLYAKELALHLMQNPKPAGHQICKPNPVSARICLGTLFSLGLVANNQQQHPLSIVPRILRLLIKSWVAIAIFAMVRHYNWSNYSAKKDLVKTNNL
jgi:hypothetical protein